MICLQISIFELLNTTMQYLILKLELVVICLQISIFELLNTTRCGDSGCAGWLWFAYKLVSLSYWIQHRQKVHPAIAVVICLQISIFELLNTTLHLSSRVAARLWFAYKLVSLSYWIQRTPANYSQATKLWFAYKLVSLSYWIQQKYEFLIHTISCDLLTN